MTKVASGRLSEPVGRNASEVRAGLDNRSADADPPGQWGRQHGTGKETVRMHLYRSAGVVDTARWQGNAGHRGRPVVVGFGPDAMASVAARQESEGIVVLTKPGNSGGGKGPHFWHACEGAEERRLAMSLVTPRTSRRSRTSFYGETKTGSRESPREAGRRAGCGKSARPVR